jgi:YD repeat-containing protein
LSWRFADPGLFGSDVVRWRRSTRSSRNGRATQFVYDSRGRKIAQIEPAVNQFSVAAGPTTTAPIVTWKYDGGNRVVASTDADGNTTRFTYDPLGRQKLEIAPYLNLPQNGPTIDDSGAASNMTGGAIGSFATVGSWPAATTGNGGFHAEYKSTTAAGASATWTVSNLPGNTNSGIASFFEVFVTWVPSNANTNKAQFTVYDGSPGSGLNNSYVTAMTIDQQAALAPSPLFTDGAWQNLGLIVSATQISANSPTISVVLTNGGNSGTALVADAVRIVQVTPTYTGYDDAGDRSFVSVGGYLQDPNHTTETDRNKLGQVTAVIQPTPSSWRYGGVAAKTTYSYDANGNLLSVTNPRGQGQTNFDQTTYKYDQQNRKIAATEANPTPGGGTSGNLVTQFFYDPDGNPTATVNAADPNNASYNRNAYNDTSYATVFAYDHLNRKVSETDPSPSSGVAGPLSTWTYNQTGELSQTSDPLTNKTYFGYNLAGEPIQSTDALGTGLGASGHTTTTLFDAVGNALAATDALGRTTFVQYDALNRKIAESDPAPASFVGQASSLTNPTTSWFYDANGNLTATVDPLGHAVDTVYNGWNLPAAVYDAAGSTTTSYDAWGNVSAVTDPLSRTTQFAYDNLQRKIAMVAPAASSITPGNGLQTVSPTTSFAYDPDGNLSSTTDPLNHTTRYFYDGWNRRTNVVDALSTASFASDAALSTQPPHGTLTTYDALGNVHTVTDELGRTTQFVYDHLNRKTEEIDPAANSIVSGVLQTVSATTFWNYDADGNVTSMTDPNNHTSYTRYDALNRADCALGSDSHIRGPAVAGRRTLAKGQWHNTSRKWR